MVKLVISVMVLFASQWAWADPGSAGPAISRATSGDSTLRDQVRGSVRFIVRRYANSHASEAAYQRLEAALEELARGTGMTVANAGQADLTIEVDSTFYVYTNRFNARLVRLPEYTEAQLAGKGTDGKLVEQQPKPVDALRIAAGAIGIVQGWISPSFGSYMIAGAAAPALFGSGAAPRRLFVAGKERFDRGEQEVNTKVRVLRDGVSVGAFAVRCWTAGDEAPFVIDALVADNWSSVLGLLQGAPIQTTAAHK